MKKILLLITLLAITLTLSACSVEEISQAVKEEFPYFFCELDPPNPI